MRKSKVPVGQKKYAWAAVVLITALFAFVGVHLASPVRASTLVGDLNTDGTVNVFDLSIFLSHWQQSGNAIQEDFNNDGAVNIFDLSIFLSHYGATISGQNIVTIPSSIASDCSVDVSAAITNWIASVPDNSILSFGTDKCYRVESPIDFSGRTGLDFEGNGSSFRVFNAPTDQDAVWRVWQSSNMKFNNMTVTGSYANGGTHDPSLQHAHGFDLRGTTAEISKVNIRKVAGDCVYFGLGSDSTTRSSGSFHDSVCNSIGRNGVSVTAGDNITVQRSSFNTIGYETFDVEPNIAAGNWGSNNVTIDSNTIGSYYLYAYSIVENGPISNQTFTNNRAVGTGLRISIGPVSTVVSRPNMVLIHSNSSDTSQTPAAFNLDDIDNLTVTGNTVPMTNGTMAAVDSSCNVNVSANSYLGGSAEVSITNPTSGC